nr:MAG TPA: hypothetical protein [Caudoviricetes sp.]
MTFGYTNSQGVAFRGRSFFIPSGTLSSRTSDGFVPTSR